MLEKIPISRADPYVSLLRNWEMILNVNREGFVKENGGGKILLKFLLTS
jgi:hypothetical protein